MRDTFYFITIRLITLSLFTSPPFPCYLYKAKLSMKMRLTLLMLLFFSSINFLNAQTLKSDSLFVPGGVKQYQLHLDKPVKSIEWLKYENSGEPIKGNLAPDKIRVILDNYKKGSRVKLKVTYEDGTVEEVVRSSCFIDPVKYEL